MEQNEIYQRALKIMDENFGHVILMSLASSSNDRVSVRDLNAFYYDGKFYVIGKKSNTLLHDIALNPNVGLCHGAHNMRGTAISLGHPLEPQNAELRKYMKKDFSLNYNEYVTEDNPEMCIVVITLTEAETYTRYHRYEIDFVNQTAKRDHSEPLYLFR